MQLALVSRELCNFHQCPGNDAAGFSVRGLIELASESRE
jgi:hypothetical protein